MGHDFILVFNVRTFVQCKLAYFPLGFVEAVLMVVSLLVCLVFRSLVSDRETINLSTSPFLFVPEKIPIFIAIPF